MKSETVHPTQQTWFLRAMMWQAVFHVLWPVAAVLAGVSIISDVDPDAVNDALVRAAVWGAILGLALFSTIGLAGHKLLRAMGASHWAFYALAGAVIGLLAGLGLAVLVNNTLLDAYLVLNSGAAARSQLDDAARFVRQVGMGSGLLLGAMSALIGWRVWSRSFTRPPGQSSKIARISRPQP